MQNLSELKKELFEIIRERVYQYKEEEFTLVSGKKSHHYFNCKNITFYPRGLNLLIRAFFLMAEDLRQDFPFNGIGGLTMGPDPLLYGLSLYFENIPDNEKMNRSFNPYLPLVVRKENKKHGTGKKIEGYIQNVNRLLAFDDVVTTAGSMIKAIESLRQQNIEISHAFAIIDREEGGRENLQKEGIVLHSLFKKSDF